MKEKIGIIYATVDGHTLKISNELVAELEQSDATVSLYSIDEFDADISDFDKFVVGSSIRYGVHHAGIIEFIKNNKEKLDAVKSVFFSVNLVARKPEKNTAETNPYVVKFFKSIDWKPKTVGVFAGMLDYAKYKFFDRIMIQFIMWITKGPTNRDAVIEYTNWDKVKDFARQIKAL